MIANFKPQKNWALISSLMIGLLAAVALSNAQAQAPTPKSEPTKSVPESDQSAPEKKAAAKSTKKAANPDIIPLMTFNDIPLPDVIATLARQAGINYILASDAIGYPVPRVTIRFENVSAKQAYDAVLKSHSLEYIPDSSGKSGAIQKQTASPAVATELPSRSAKEAATITQIIPLITFDQTPLADAMKTLARQAGVNYVVPPGTIESPDKLVTIRFKNVTAGEALDSLLSDHGLKFHLEQGKKIGTIQRR